MPHHSREIIEGYALETISRSQTIQGRCKTLLSKDFASQSPRSLAKTLIKMCHYLEEATKSIYKSIDRDALDENKLKSFMLLFQDTDTIIRELGAHVRFIDGARTQRVPWSVVKPIEKFIENFLPGISIMLRPQWKYNYSIVTTDLQDAYYNTLIEYNDFLPDEDLDEVFKDLPNHFHIISFPSLERKNILLHCLVSHELGHLISRKFLSKLSTGKFLKNVSDEILENIKKSWSSTPEESPLFTQYQLKLKAQQEIERASLAWQRGLEELLSDIIGGLLFGPAMLFSTLEIAIQDELDHKPDQSNNFYPPWRSRLRVIQDVIQNSSEKFFPLSKDFLGSTNVNNRFDLINRITSTDEDQKVIQNDPTLKIAYQEIEKNIAEAKKHFQVELKESIVKPSELYKRLDHLIERLDNGIPPNAYEESINKREPATIVEIINAAWFHKIAWEDKIFHDNGAFNEDICKKRDIMNRLTLKAIEYAYIENNYRDEKGKPDKFEVDYS